MRLKDIGEKKLIADYIRPLFNPAGIPESIGDDCALISTEAGEYVCISTDRVPADLIAFKLGLIDYAELGQYLAILNISDIAAVGGTPKALLLNLAFPGDFPLKDMQDIMTGVKVASEKYGVVVVGGDLSDAKEMNLMAISVGFVPRERALLRSGAQPGDKVFCSDYVGITPSAFSYFLKSDSSKPATFNAEQETLLITNFKHPKAQVDLGRQLASSGCCTSAMDVTDGIAQSFSEIAVASAVGIVLQADSLPIHSVSVEIADHYGLDLLKLVLGPGADFQLVGTLNPLHASYAEIASQVKIIGDVVAGEGLYLKVGVNPPSVFTPEGWNYYIDQ